MTKIVLFYFSGTGNTKWVCETMTNHLANREDLTSLPLPIDRLNRTITSKFVEATDILGIAFPIYGGAPPEIMIEFIKTIPPTNNKRALIICTQAHISFNGGHAVVDILKSKGYDVEWCIYIKMPNSLCISQFPYTLFKYSNDPKYISPILKKAKKRIQLICSRILKGKSYKQGFLPFSKIFGGLYRLICKDRFKNKLSIMNKNCTDCNICSENCPMHCIKIVGGCRTIGKECTSCMRCYNFCPNNDILFSNVQFRLKYGSPYHGPDGTNTLKKASTTDKSTK